MTSLHPLSRNVQTHEALREAQKHVGLCHSDFASKSPDKRRLEILHIQRQLQLIQNLPNAIHEMGEQIQLLQDDVDTLQIRQRVITQKNKNRVSQFPTLTHDLLLTIREFLPEVCGNAMNTTCKALRTHTRLGTTNFDTEEREQYRKRMSARKTAVPEGNDCLVAPVPSSLPSDAIEMLIERGPLLEGRVTFLKEDGGHYTKPYSKDEFARTFMGRGLFHKLREFVTQMPPEERIPEVRNAGRRIRHRDAQRAPVNLPPPPNLRNIAMLNMGIDLPRLDRLTLIEPTLEDLKLILRNFRRMPHIELRGCSGNLFNDEFVAMATQFPSLKISGDVYTAIPFLAQVASLVELSTTSAPSWQNLAPLAELPRLHTLNFVNCGSLKEGGTIAVMAKSQSLKAINFTSQYSDATLAQFPPDFSLNRLSIHGGWLVNPTVIQALSRSSIKALSLSNCWHIRDNLLDKHLIQLADCRTLTSLHVDKCPEISTESIIELVKRSNSLQQLDLSGQGNAWDIDKIEEVAHAKGIRVLKPNREVTFEDRLQAAFSAGNKCEGQANDLFMELSPEDQRWIYRKFWEIIGKPSGLGTPIEAGKIIFHDVDHRHNVNGVKIGDWGKAIDAYIKHKQSNAIVRGN